ncbi:MAG: acyltransferase [Clostridia bacterium]|nr:acyltransferase [Clostridia bacterium]
MKDKRHQGIDLMRVICMLMIVLYHLQGHGGLVGSQQISAENRTLLVILQSVYQVAVDGYALISGYIGYTSRHKYRSLVMLWLRVLFYSVGMTALIWLISPATVSWASIRNAFFPLLKGQYWYFNAYVGCFVFFPFVRAAVDALSQKELRRTLSGIVLVFSVLPYVMRSDPLTTSGGNHAMWLLVLYALGAYFRKYQSFENASVGALAGAVACAAVIQSSAGFVLQMIGGMLGGKTVTQWYFICHDSPTTLFLAAAMLALFSRLPFRCDSGMFRLLVSASFSVYLIHDHPLVRQHVIIPLASRLTALPEMMLIPSVFLCGAAIYLVCAGIDFLRERLFAVLRVRVWVDKAAGKLSWS